MDLDLVSAESAPSTRPDAENVTLMHRIGPWLALFATERHLFSAHPAIRHRRAVGAGKDRPPVPDNLQCSQRTALSQPG